MSSLCMAPTVAAAYAKDELIAIFTANGNSLEPMRKLIKDECGIDPHDKRFVVVGCQDVPIFGKAVAEGLKVDWEAVTPHMVKLAQDTVKANPDLRAIIFECTELPPYSDAVREATGLPVFDSITTSNAFIASMQDNSRFGANDWQKNWDGKSAVPPSLGGRLLAAAQLAERQIWLENSSEHDVVVAYAPSGKVSVVESIGKPGWFELKFAQVCRPSLVPLLMTPPYF